MPDWILAYDRAVVPLVRRLAKGITMLQRIGAGMVTHRLHSPARAWKNKKGKKGERKEIPTCRTHS
uniref:Uncharacterized protein n=1 Tax=Leersia perrieri TaxID=77586 RepID=A0A0D9W4N5_9ORYZ